jgi:hypothetical protein
VEDTSGYTNNASALFRQESRVKNVETKQNLRCNVKLSSLSIGLVSLSLHVVLYSFTLREKISIISTNRNR